MSRSVAKDSVHGVQLLGAFQSETFAEEQKADETNAKQKQGAGLGGWNDR